MRPNATEFLNWLTADGQYLERRGKRFDRRMVAKRGTVFNRADASVGDELVR